MRSSEEIVARIRECIDSMIKRPKMWAQNLFGLEEQFLLMCGILDFAMEKDQIRVADKWRRFAADKIGFSGPAPVSHWMCMKNLIDIDGIAWSALTDVMEGFVAESYQ